MNDSVPTDAPALAAAGEASREASKRVRAQGVVSQERLSAEARPLSPQPFAFAVVQAGQSFIDVKLGNAGPSALQLIVHRHHLLAVPALRYDLMPGQSVAAEIPADSGIYDVAVHGPDGFLRAIAGDMASTLAGFEASLTITGPASSPGLRLELRNGDGVTRVLQVANRVGSATSHRIAPGSSHEVLFQPLKHDAGWYDFTVTVEGVSSFSRRFAGHLTKGRPAR